MISARVLATLGLLSLLAACNPQNPSMGTGDKAKEGELCGGIAGILCDDGLTCKNDEDFPDSAGTCVKE